MRVTKEVAEQNRRKILETATRLFKTRGIDNVSVADLMKAAGFTHGGFYNHFESKADLAAETVRYAFEQALDEIVGRGAAPTEDPVPMAERLAHYLSPAHRDDPTGGCPTGSLPVDAGRQSVEAQRAFADGLERYLELIGDVDLASTLKRDAAIVTLSTLVGAIVLARAVRDGNPALSDELLDVTRRDRPGKKLQ
jgi:TetR/AcrR family transcriptional repressor of nem operon